MGSTAEVAKTLQACYLVVDVGLWPEVLRQLLKVLPNLIPS